MATIADEIDSNEKSHSSEDFLTSLYSSKECLKKEQTNEPICTQDSIATEDDQDVLNLLDTLTFNDLPPLSNIEYPILKSRSKKTNDNSVPNPIIYNIAQFHKLSNNKKLEALSCLFARIEENKCERSVTNDDEFVLAFKTHSKNKSPSASEETNDLNSGDVFVSRFGRVTKRKIYYENFDSQKQFKTNDKEWVKDKTKPTPKKPAGVSKEDVKLKEVPFASTAHQKKRPNRGKKLTNKEIMEKSSLFKDIHSNSSNKSENNTEVQDDQTVNENKTNSENLLSDRFNKIYQQDEDVLQLQKKNEKRETRLHTKSSAPSTSISEETEKDQIACPICSKMFSKNDIEDHAWKCN